jgi:hypothetical protein
MVVLMERGVKGKRLGMKRKVSRRKELMVIIINFIIAMRIRESKREENLKEFPGNEAAQLSEGMERFRDEMLAKIETSQSDDGDLLKEVYEEQVPPLENVVKTPFIEEVFDEQVIVKKPLLIEEIQERVLIEEIKEYETITGIKTVIDAPAEHQFCAFEGPSTLYQDPKQETVLFPMTSIIEEIEECGDTDYYVSPLEQRRADLELMMEAASSGDDCYKRNLIVPNGSVKVKLKKKYLILVMAKLLRKRM